MKRNLKNRTILHTLSLAILIIYPASAIYADVLILKNGRQIKAEQFWEEDGIVKYSLHGAVVGHPRSDIERIIKAGDSTQPNSTIQSIFYPWGIGQRIEEVFELCERYDLPLHRDGLISANKKFNPKMCLPYINTHSKFKYKSFKYKCPSEVLFSFDPSTRKLNEVNIRILKPTKIASRDFKTFITSKLSNSYGSPQEIDKIRCWQKGNDFIELADVNYAALVKLSNEPGGFNNNLEGFKEISTSIVSKPTKGTNNQLKGLSSAVIRSMVGPLIIIFLLFAMMAFFKVVIKRKFRGFLSSGIKTKKTTPRYRGSFFGRNKTPSEDAYSYEKPNGLFTNAERAFLTVLKEAVGGEYLIQGKVRLADLISPATGLTKNKSMWAFRKISQKHVDFVLCNKNDYTILGVIELDDKSHLQADRIARDQFVDSALATANIPILHYPVKAKYSCPDLQDALSTALGIEFWNNSKDKRFQDGSKNNWGRNNSSSVDSDEARWAAPRFKS